MSLLSAYEDSQDPDFQKRVAAAIDKAAQDVSAEAVGLYPEVYRKRQTLAYRVKYQNADVATAYALSLTAPGLVTKNSSDGDIEFTVNAQWDAFAGVTELDKV